MHVLLIICASEMLTYLPSRALSDRTFSATAFWVFFWGFAFGLFFFFNSISAITFSRFLPTNKPILIISCYAVTFSNVLSSSTILSEIAIAGACCPSEAAAVPWLISALVVTVWVTPEAQQQYVPPLQSLSC